MPLTTCPDCGKAVSDRAPACLNCGCPRTAIIDSGGAGPAEYVTRWQFSYRLYFIWAWSVLGLLLIVLFTPFASDYAFWVLMAVPIGSVLCLRRVRVLNNPEALGVLKVRQETEFEQWGDRRGVLGYYWLKRYGVWGMLWRALVYSLLVTFLVIAFGFLVDALL